MSFIGTAGKNTGFGIMPASRTMASTLILAGVLASATAMAQQTSGRKETIAPFGSDMTVQKADDSASLGDVLEAIDAASADTSKIKVMSTLDSVRIVRVGKITDSKGKIDAAVKAHREDIRNLQTAVEGNALTFAAINAQSISTAKIVGIRITGEQKKTVTLYVQR